jgi:hypothetical protein
MPTVRTREVQWNVLVRSAMILGFWPAEYSGGNRWQG